MKHIGGSIPLDRCRSGEAPAPFVTGQPTSIKSSKGRNPGPVVHKPYRNASLRLAKYPHRIINPRVRGSGAVITRIWCQSYALLVVYSIVWSINGVRAMPLPTHPIYDRNFRSTAPAPFVSILVRFPHSRCRLDFSYRKMQTTPRSLDKKKEHRSAPVCIKKPG
jgi:hypothetical protein